MATSPSPIFTEFPNDHLVYNAWEIEGTAADYQNLIACFSLLRPSLPSLARHNSTSITGHMASNEAPAATTAAGGEGDTRSRTVTLHILCPSQPIPGRFTLNDLPLETTVGELRVRITQSVPSQPPPATQRLIYRGRPLTTESQTLSEILGSVEVSLAIATPTFVMSQVLYLINTDSRNPSTRYTWSYHLRQFLYLPITMPLRLVPSLAQRDRIHFQGFDYRMYDLQSTSPLMPIILSLRPWEMACDYACQRWAQDDIRRTF